MNKLNKNLTFFVYCFIIFLNKFIIVVQAIFIFFLTLDENKKGNDIDLKQHAEIIDSLIFEGVGGEEKNDRTR